MLINFCRKPLKTAICCSTVSNDGYEVTNLISDSDKGFLAYSCIKPPIHIDFTFTCDIRVSHVVIWPNVGAQKSSGFELCVKSASNLCSEYKRVSTGFLSATHLGILFYRRDIFESNFGADPNFLQRYIHASNSQVVDNVRNLRISILKTENSVPAIGRVQIWGWVSKNCNQETVNNVHKLWENHCVWQPKAEVKTDETNSENIPTVSGEAPEKALNVPEDFMDPITCSIMIEPIILPSGVTIDQSTLEKHAKSEATWGRALSDPFTGIRFNETRKPVFASALKARIDKFLLENQNAPDIKNLPRVSGYKQVPNSLQNRPVNLSEITPGMNTAMTTPNLDSKKSYNNKIATRTLSQSVLATRISHPKIQEQTRAAHKLPVIPMCSKRAVTKRNLKMPNIKPAVSLAIKKEINSIVKPRLTAGSNIESNLDHNVQTVLSGLRHFNETERSVPRKCLKDCPCSIRIFYKLPCKHVVCKDVLMSTKNSQCGTCGKIYSSRDPERVHPLSILD